ncbi:hypothetical protein [Streptomyces coeruleorubidus]|uniref:hypothetical protein n=1 Tax=Streptomyces coeruleorubidus TaxID=116188 RepID=UPI0033B4C984
MPNNVTAPLRQLLRGTLNQVADRFLRSAAGAGGAFCCHGVLTYLSFVGVCGRSCEVRCPFVLARGLGCP